jgi:hypothetical protein
MVGWEAEAAEGAEAAATAAVAATAVPAVAATDPAAVGAADGLVVAAAEQPDRATSKATRATVNEGFNIGIPLIATDLGLFIAS